MKILSCCSGGRWWKTLSCCSDGCWWKILNRSYSDGCWMRSLLRRSFRSPLPRHHRRHGLSGFPRNHLCPLLLYRLCPQLSCLRCSCFPALGSRPGFLRFPRNPARLPGKLPSPRLRPTPELFPPDKRLPMAAPLPGSPLPPLYWPALRRIRQNGCRLPLR